MMVGTTTVVQGARLGQLAIFGALTIGALYQWRRRPGPGAAWLATVLGIVAVDTGIARATGVDPLRDPRSLAGRLVIALILLIPYALFRFTASFEHPAGAKAKTRMRVATAATAVTVGLSLVVAHFPGMPNRHTIWFRGYMALVVVVWTALSGWSARRLWTGGAGQPAVVRRRMQLLAMVSVLLNIGLLAGVRAAYATPGLQVVIPVFGWLTGLLMYLAYAPPAALRAAWRRAELDEFHRAEAALMTATTAGQVTDVILPHAIGVVGGRAALITEDGGRVIAAHGMGPAEAADLAEALNRLRPEAGEVPRLGVVAVPVNHGWLAVLDSPYTPLFGADELGLLAALGHLAELALERVRLSDRELEGRQALLDRERQLAQAQQLARIGSWQWRIGDDVITWSDELYRIFGLEPGQRPVNFDWYLGRVHPDDREAVQRQVERSIDTRIGFMSEYRVVLADGRVRWLHSRGQVIVNGDGEAVGLQGVCQEVTEQRQSRDELLARSRQQAAVARIGQRALSEVDMATLMQEACALVAEVLGVEMTKFFELEEGRMCLRAGVGWRPGLVGHFSFDVSQSSHSTFTLASSQPVVSEDLDNETRYEVHPILREHGVKSGISVVVPGQTAPLGVFSANARSVRGYSPGEVDFLQAVANVLGSVIERRRTDDQLAHQALHDPLTGLPNRGLLIDRLEQALARRARTGGGLAVLFLDVDRFKLVNDGLGHGAGDELLKAVAARLLHVVRPSDTVARFGGDEFVVVCEEATDEPTAVSLANRICESLSDRIEVGSRRMQVTVSVGIALAEPGRTDPEAVLRDADAAMYRAKERGRARVELFDSSLRERVMERLDAEAALRQAIDGEELRLVFQPEVSLADGTVVGVESLLRWQHPEKGLLGPGAFLPMAEETGLIVQMGTWALEEACRHATEWRGNNLDAPPFVVWVNLSARQLCEPGLSDRVREILERTGADPTMLGIEITESVLMEDIDAVGAALTALEALGLKLAIDDFGTGFSSLSYLKQFPVHMLKVDQSFVAGLGQDDGDSAIVRAVIELAHSLGLTCVAEGVETAQQMSALRRLGCDSAQGYYFDRPGSPAAISALLSSGSHPAHAGRRVLVCDDDPDTRMLYRLALEHEGVKVDEATTGAQCLEMAERLAPDVVVLDVFLPDVDGLSALPALMRLLPSARVLVVSARGTSDLAVRSRELGAEDCFDKVDFVPRLPQLVRRYLSAA
ncbi:MAG: EAL domain-containing protein [Actinobacteria bacterium]|nr:EAL domain-containing protein [Actinomycetota bacterium]